MTKLSTIKNAEKVKIYKGLFPVNWYFLGMMDEKEKEAYIKHAKQWLRDEQEYTEKRSRYVYLKLKTIYEIVLEHNEGKTIKTTEGWLSQLYVKLEVIDRYFKTIEQEQEIKEKYKQEEDKHGRDERRGEIPQH